MRLQTVTLALGMAAALAVPSAAQMPAGMTHEQHLKQMSKEEKLDHFGAAAMGFDQRTTSHHFVLQGSGGAIVVTAKDSADVASRDAIRAHLKEIARQFASGDFAKPLMTHGELPDGANDMQRLADRITYRYEESSDGGRVAIETADAQALDAIHRFLRYQIREHKTGDPLTPAPSRVGA